MELSQKYHLLVFAKKCLLILGALLFIVLVILLVGYLTRQSEFAHRASLYGQEDVSSPAPGKALEKKRPLADYLKAFKARNIFTPGADLTFKDILADVEEKWKMRLTGTIVDPNGLSVAFIIDNNGEEGAYYKGDKIGRWEIKSIRQDKVILVDAAGNETELKRKGEVSTKTSQKRPTLTSSKQLESEEVPSELAKLDESDIILRLKPIIKSMSPQVVRERIEAATGIRQEEIPEDTDLTEYVTDLIHLSQDGVIEEEAGVAASVSFSTKVNPDNSPQSPDTIFTGTDKRIYACFANQGELKGLKNIITRWVDAADGSIIFIGNKTINPTTTWNYVWLEKRQGWEKGTYSVQLFKTSALKKVVAQGTFEIR